MAYQIYSRVWDGQVRYIAKVGKPFVSKDTGLFGIITELEDHTAADFFLAARQAKKELTRLADQAFQQRLQQQQATFSKDRSAPVSTSVPPPVPPVEGSVNGVAKAAQGCPPYRLVTCSTATLDRYKCPVRRTVLSEVSGTVHAPCSFLSEALGEAAVVSTVLSA